MLSALTTFFTNWTARHWLNFGIFGLGSLITSLSITATTHWGDLPRLFTPFTTIGFLVTVLGFLLQTATGEPRDPKRGTRATDPEDTERVVQVGNKVVAVPPVVPGRPVDPDAPKPEVKP
jgi:hypothetical protein